MGENIFNEPNHTGDPDTASHADQHIEQLVDLKETSLWLSPG
jgi:hypothetical protein